jgi:hypothetical protein
METVNIIVIDVQKNEVSFSAEVDGRRYVAYGTYSAGTCTVEHGPTQDDVDMICRLVDSDATLSMNE